MINKEIDILIIGGGLTGATLMLALQGLGYNTLLVEAKPFSDKINPDFDARSLALSPASRRILTMLGVWDLLKDHATAIDMIHVSDQSHFGISRLHGESDAPLGHVAEMQHINQALHQLLPHDQIIAPASLKSLDYDQHSATILTDSGEINVAARLIVAADGAQSSARRFCSLPAKTKLYGQHAIVANVGLLKPHGHRAYERFTMHGPLALLPMQDNRMSLVWAVPPKEADHLLSLSDADFLRELQQAFGYRLGRFAKVGKRFSYPLQQVLMPIQAKWPVVFVGNAAHTLHPVAGQGFNLGLRDVATLAQCIAEQGLNAEMVQHYVQLRSHDQKAITRLTDGLIHVFTSRLPGFGVARGLGLIALDNIPVLKNLLARYARGFGGVVPDLVCEIALPKR
ncbi:2-octaprenyl-6-methoxyphenyl hydroxylase [Fluoribacter gormanii]|uniref:2-octaprenyl-6-methoxyphenol hydroxylase n=1 Tax=Fluoribacter gormanii TaxID=464 RepID=A0A377GPA9_9GAMM|nr:2-octaprenyl-6-methoxyphenyl hydroxylase [Fluoribacter gormanii]KTD03857.1 2-octaprenyl-6-methoxyphenol hydroxylase [Fluoribacter gormanii]MCW8445305.1 2-octaprenyl-6-methoxyphenyl hydroxylase [Fluoribacter gormanii]MCW8470510.1 2-octaprenyl-6-methoxyphenyl hydroxylase [Fluoribacter gormanii]SIR86569.1 2-octaprenyl-6-methoxyphenol hydroxylase /2-octaprenyl-3-methyl-6-methoxy-1,4-benzoquinol hydroxylase [Fluoribacter gormanii]STO26335.1 2-octaprenyl-6-methoxyphenol hydroxylase [Fluoribacter 